MIYFNCKIFHGNVSIVIVNYQFSWNNIQQNIADLWEILLERETYFFVVTNCSLCKLKNVGKLIIFLVAYFACAHCFCNFVTTYARPVCFNFQPAILYEFATCFEIELNVRVIIWKQQIFLSFFFLKCFFNWETNKSVFLVLNSTISTRANHFAKLEACFIGWYKGIVTRN